MYIYIYISDTCQSPVSTFRVIWSKFLRDTFQSFEFTGYIGFNLRRRGAAKPQKVKDLGDCLHTRPVSFRDIGGCCFPPISKFSGDKNKSKWEILKRCFFEKDSNFRHEALGNKKRLLCHLSIMLFHCFCFNWIHFRGKNMFAIHNPDHKESDGQTDGLRKILNMP